MSVVFVKGRITRDASEFDRFRQSDCSLLLTDAQHCKDFSVELTCGENYDDEVSEERAVMYAIKGDTLSIRPGACIVLEVAEHLRVPNNMYGIVMPKGHILLEQGILMASTKIEPSYDGQLRLLLHNASHVRRQIAKGTVVASAVFFRTEQTLEGVELTRLDPYSEKPRGVFKLLTDSIAADPKFLLMFLATLFSSIAAAILTVWLKHK